MMSINYFPATHKEYEVTIEFSAEFDFGPHVTFNGCSPNPE